MKYLWILIVAVILGLGAGGTAYAADQNSASRIVPKVRFHVINDALTGVVKIRGVLYLPKTHSDKGDYYMGFWSPVPADLAATGFHWSGLYRGSGCRVSSSRADGSLVMGSVAEGNICVFLSEYHAGYEGKSKQPVQHQGYACARIQDWDVEGAQKIPGTSMFGFGGGFGKASPTDQALLVDGAEHANTYEFVLADRVKDPEAW